jgi:parallel beta-helix repeat protein
MKYTSKNIRMSVFSRLAVALTTILFVLALSDTPNAGGFHSHKGRPWKPEPVSCGDTITTHTSLYTDLDCSNYSEGAALTLQEGANLNMNGKKIIGNSDINCIEITGDGVKIREGAVTQCDYGIRVRSDHNRITSVKVSDSDNVGIRIDGNENRITSVKVSDSNDRGIRITGDENRITSAKVSGSNDSGIRIQGNGNWITSAKVSGSNDRGVRIQGNENLLIWCTVTFSHTQGIKIDGGNNNRVYSNTVFDNCRDGIEIEGGDDNTLLYNQVENNGNPETCAYFGEEYKPWFYAGIDVLAGAENNEIKDNRAGCNSGCVGSDDFPCSARERDFWDENVDTGDNGAAINEWKDNSIVCKNAMPERSPNPAP